MFLRSNWSVSLVQCEFRSQCDFPGRVAPTGQTLRRLAAHLKDTGASGTVADVAGLRAVANSRLS